MLAAEVERGGVGERFGQVADDASGSGLGVDSPGSRRSAPPLGGLAAEGVDPPAERRHRHVAGRVGRVATWVKLAAVGGRQDRVERSLPS